MGQYQYQLGPDQLALLRRGSGCTVGVCYAAKNWMLHAKNWSATLWRYRFISSLAVYVGLSPSKSEEFWV